MIGELRAQFSVGELAGLDQNTIIDNEEDSDKYDAGEIRLRARQQRNPTLLLPHIVFYRRHTEFG